jgi:5,5'-dehydrodivanillate O-demethylase
MAAFDDFVTGPGTVGGRYMRAYWQPVYCAQDLAPGQAVPIRIMGENFTLYSGESGKAHVVGFRCAHRGTPLTTGWVEGDCIRCLYHGWKYEATGQCVEQPGEDATFAAKVRLPSYPTEEYLGLVFAYLGEGDAPPLRRFPELEQDGVLLTDPPEPWPCHFLNRLDNDMAHVPWTHRESLRRTGALMPPLRYYAHNYVETEFGIADPTGAGNSHLLPNMNVLRNPMRNARWQGVFQHRLIFFVPVDDANSIAFDLTFVPGLTGQAAEAFREFRQEALSEYDSDSLEEIAKAILAGKMSVRDVPASLSREQQFMIEDYVTQVGQGPPSERDPEHLGRNDALVILFRKVWRREARALAEGRPLTAWKSTGIWAHWAAAAPAAG